MTPEPSPEVLGASPAGLSPKKCRKIGSSNKGLRRVLIFCEVKICTTDGSAFFAASRNEVGVVAGAVVTTADSCRATTLAEDGLSSHSGLSVLTTKRTARLTVTVCAKINQSLRMGEIGASK